MVRILAGDAMNINAKSSQHLLHPMKKFNRDLGGSKSCLVVIKYASHQSNPVLMAAICGCNVKGVACQDGGWCTTRVTKMARTPTSITLTCVTIL